MNSLFWGYPIATIAGAASAGRLRWRLLGLKVVVWAGFGLSPALALASGLGSTYMRLTTAAAVALTLQTHGCGCCSTQDSTTDDRCSATSDAWAAAGLADRFAVVHHHILTPDMVQELLAGHLVHLLVRERLAGHQAHVLSCPLLRPGL